MKAYGGVDEQIHIFLSSALVGGEWSASRLSRFTLGERTPGTHWIGGWVNPRAGLDNMERRKFLTYRDWKSNSDPSFLQPVASRYDECAIAPPLIWILMEPMSRNGTLHAIIVIRDL
jgi:hypothetical protein